jgi:nucleotide-binding universal stress UspA family protein
MGHSRKGIKRMITGSVAGHVVKGSPVPVLIVNPDTTAAAEDTD